MYILFTYINILKLCLVSYIILFMDNQPDELKHTALMSSVYFQDRINDVPIDQIDFDYNLDTEAVKEHMRNSVLLFSNNKNYRHMIVEILDVMNQYRQDFLMDNNNCIIFSWNGLVIYKINMNKDKQFNHNKQLHVSLQKYNTEKEILKKKQEAHDMDLSLNRVMYGGLVALVVLGCGFAGLTYWRK